MLNKGRAMLLNHRDEYVHTCTYICRDRVTLWLQGLNTHNKALDTDRRLFFSHTSISVLPFQHFSVFHLPIIFIYVDDMLRVLKEKEFLVQSLFYCGRMGGSGGTGIRIVRGSNQRQAPSSFTTTSTPLPSPGSHQH